jgi:hypothetical protein
MFKGIVKGTLTAAALKTTSKGIRRGLIPGLHRTAQNLKFRRFIWILKTDYVGAFSVFFTKATGEPVRWSFGDGQGAVANSFTFTYSIAGIKTIRARITHPERITNIANYGGSGIIGVVDLRRFIGLNSFVSFNFSSNLKLTKIRFPKIIGGGQITINCSFSGLTGTFDVSMIDGAFPQLAVSGNRGLTDLQLPKFGRTCGYLYISNCNFRGTLDTTGLILNGYFDVGGNNWQKILFRSSTGLFNSGFYINSCPYLTGVLDLSMLSGLGVDIRINNNAQITAILFGASTQVVTAMQLDGCPMLGSIDVSMFNNFSNYFTCTSCTSCTSITFPITTQLFTVFGMNNCNLTGLLDMSGISGFGGTFNISSNPNLTGITFAAVITGNDVTVFNASSCNLTGTLDLSTITKLRDNVQLTNNPNLTVITLPANSYTLAFFQVINCNVSTINITAMPNATSVNNVNWRLDSNTMTSGEVDTILADIDSISVAGFTSRTIIISGSNAAPGAIGLAAKASLIFKGFTVTTN